MNLVDRIEHNIEIKEGVNLYAIELGQGRPMIMLHGNNEDHSYFDKQIEYFSEFYRVIAIDSYAHGKSSYSGDKFNLRLIADYICIAIDQLDIRSAIWLGFSDGGNIVIDIAIRYSHLVDKLVLNGANLTPCSVKLLVQIPTVINYVWYSILSVFNKKWTIKRDIVGLMTKEPWFKPYDLQSIHKPTLVIVGNDDLIKLSGSKKIARLTQGTMVILDGSHFVSSEQPFEFNRVVYEFCIKN